MSVLIRKMTAADVPDAHAIDVGSFTLPWPERSLRFEVSENQAARCWVGEMDGKVLGMMVLWKVVDEVHIATLAVHPDCRRRGLAKRLLVHALQAAYLEGGRSAYLEVRESNQAAQAMYANFGFEEVGRRTRYYKDNGEDAILMKLSKLEGMVESG
ncbi:MAG: ribosomal protein S18-alanine N-acetyltransferase [Anaerolineales bacterium]